MTAARRRRPPSRRTPQTVTLGQSLCSLHFLLKLHESMIYTEHADWTVTLCPRARALNILCQPHFLSYTILVYSCRFIFIFVSSTERLQALARKDWCWQCVLSVSLCVCAIDLWPPLIPLPDSAWTARVTAVTARTAPVETPPRPHRNTAPPTTKWVTRASNSTLRFNWHIDRSWNDLTRKYVFKPSMGFYSCWPTDSESDLPLTILVL